MVDVASHIANRQSAVSGLAAAATRPALSVSVARAGAVAFEAYRDFCADAVKAPAQHPIWVEAWARHMNPEMVIVTMRRGGRVVAMLPLEIVSQGVFKVARYPGGNHANGNFPPVAAGSATAFTAQDLSAIVDALRTARPDIDLLTLERNNPEIDHNPHPLAAHATQTSPNVSLAVDLTQGFDALLDRMSGKKKRKKYKTHLRKFDDMGGHEISEARSPDDVERLLQQFYDMKARRFAKAGIPNVFSDAATQAFFRDIFISSLEVEAHPFVIDALEVGGKVLAINGLSITGRSAVCEFGTVCDEARGISPGYFLDYHHIAKYAERGKCFYDFSVGDEDYKRSWCEVETWQFDCAAALSTRGTILRGYSRARARAIGFVKSNDRLLAMAKDLRKRFTRSSAA